MAACDNSEKMLKAKQSKVEAIVQEMEIHLHRNDKKWSHACTTAEELHAQVQQRDKVQG